MKKMIKKTAIIMAFIMSVIGTASSTVTVSAYSGSSYCNHISCRRYWDGSNGGLPRTCFEDYCPYCGTVFGRGSTPGSVSIPSAGSAPFSNIVYVPY